MRCFGKRQEFAIEYELHNGYEGYFDLWVDNKSICCFFRNNEKIKYKWDLLSIVEWLKDNITNILEEREFPLPVVATTSLEFYNLSGEFDTDNIALFEEWFFERQKWYFRHSWYVSRAGSYLADVLFWRINEKKIEIAWDNSGLYPEVDFVHPKGTYYVDVDMFQKVVIDFVRDFYRK